MTVAITGPNGQPAKAADYQAWADSLTVAQNAFLWNVLLAAIERQDMTIILQLYAAGANVWERTGESERASGAGEAEDRFFTREALEKDAEERERAWKIVDAQAEAASDDATDGATKRLIM